MPTILGAVASFVSHCPRRLLHSSLAARFGCMLVEGQSNVETDPRHGWAAQGSGDSAQASQQTAAYWYAPPSNMRSRFSSQAALPPSVPANAIMN
jgi:hypothetical protein